MSCFRRVIRRSDETNLKPMSTTTENCPVQTIQAYLFFNGRCQEALDFYQAALGAEIGMVMHFKDNPENPDSCPGGHKVNPESVMHASFVIKGSTVMASDGMGQDGPKFEGFTLSYTADDEAEAHQRFNALGAGGKVVMPLGKTFYSPCFGMVEDRFGLSWMVIVPHPAGTPTC